MAEKELESVMLKFIRDEADVLVSTTIVENGLDIPRANTILINRADRLGLAELYQLRGRVGRSHQRAYAYLLVPPEGTLSDIARKRLSAMKEFSELGAGFRIAALDLELRGAGNMLGRQQHGHIESIGFDLYCQMLERAVSKLKGEESAPELRTTLSLGLDVRIPQNYIPSENLRLRTYKRVSSIAVGRREARMSARSWKTVSARCRHQWITFWSMPSSNRFVSGCGYRQWSAKAAESPYAFTRRRRSNPRPWSRWYARERASNSTPAVCCGWK